MITVSQPTIGSHYSKFSHWYFPIEIFRLRLSVTVIILSGALLKGSTVKLFP